MSRVPDGPALRSACVRNLRQWVWPPSCPYPLLTQLSRAERCPQGTVVSSCGPWALGASKGHTGTTRTCRYSFPGNQRLHLCMLEGRVSASQAPGVLPSDLSQWSELAEWQLMSYHDFLCCLLSPAVLLSHGSTKYFMDIHGISMPLWAPYLPAPPSLPPRIQL